MTHLETNLKRVLRSHHLQQNVCFRQKTKSYKYNNYFIVREV